MKLNNKVKAPVAKPVVKQPVASRTAPVKKMLNAKPKAERIRRSTEEIEEIKDAFISMKPLDPTKLGGVIMPKSMRPAASGWAKAAGLTVVSFSLPKDDSQAVFIALKTK